VAYKARFGEALLKSDEPEALGPEDFHAAMVTPKAADEPTRLNAEDFVEDRMSGLVRAALEKQLISVGRAAEIMGVDLKIMRRQIASWVE
jgi:hypothetical protein